MPPAAQRPLPPRPPDCVTRTGARSVSSFAAFSKPPAETDVAHASVAAATRRENFFILITILPINSGQAAFRPLKPSLTRNSFFLGGNHVFCGQNSAKKAAMMRFAASKSLLSIISVTVWMYRVPTTIPTARAPAAACCAAAPSCPPALSMVR